MDDFFVIPQTPSLATQQAVPQAQSLPVAWQQPPHQQQHQQQQHSVPPSGQPAWTLAPFINKVRVVLTAEAMVLSCTSQGNATVCINRRTLAVTPAPASPTEAEHMVFAVLGLLQLARGAHLVCVTDSACVLSVDGKRIHRAEMVTLIRVSPPPSASQADAGASSKASEEALEEAESYCRFLAEQFRFYFSVDYDFTHTCQRWHTQAAMGAAAVTDRRFFWNSHLAAPFEAAGFGRWVLPVTDAFVGMLDRAPLDDLHCQYVVISRRGKRRAGTRYLCRGVDLRGNVANFVETEQIVVRPDGWLASYVQVRGSIPVVWQQRGEGTQLNPRPVPRFVPGWQWAHDRHVDELQRLYGSAVTAVSLVDYHGHEAAVGQTFEMAARHWNAAHPERAYRFVWFDFHTECKGNRYDQVDVLAGRVVDVADFFVRDERSHVVQTQRGVVRTNCIDCLDRTNVFQSVVAHRVLARQLAYLGLLDKSDLLERHETFESSFKNIWADNADEMSRRYTGVGALKTDFTRTGKRTGKGLMADGLKSVQRMAQHVFKDADKQLFIDLFLGNACVAPRPTGAPGRLRVVAFAVEGAHHLVEVDEAARVLLYHTVATQVETRIALTDVFSIGRVHGTAGTVRVWLKTQPDPVKLAFRSPSVRQDFIDLCSALAGLPRHAAGTDALDIMTVTWNNPAAPTSAAATFGHLPRTAAIIALALQAVHYDVNAPAPGTATSVESAGMTSEWHFVSSFREYLGPDYELVQCVGGASARLATFVRIDMLPFLDNVHSCTVGAAPLGNAPSPIETLHAPTKSFSSMVKDKFTAVRATLSTPSLSAVENTVGCAALLSVFGVPLCFLNTGPPPLRDGANPLVSTASMPKHFVYFMGSPASAFDSFNVFSASPHTYWMGSGSPQLYDVSAWLCLASNEAVRGHVLAAEPAALASLMSSDPPGAAGGGAPGARAVACCFRVPLLLHSTGARVQVAVSDVLVGPLGEAPPALHLSFASSCSLDALGGPVSTPATQSSFWPGPVTLQLLLANGGSEWIVVDVYSERTHVSRGRLLVQDAFSKAEISLPLRDSRGSLWGTCKLRTRGSVLPKTPVASTSSPSSFAGSPALTRAAAAPAVPSRNSVGGGGAVVLPPVPRRPANDNNTSNGGRAPDLIDFSSPSPNVLSPAGTDWMLDHHK